MTDNTSIAPHAEHRVLRRADVEHKTGIKPLTCMR